MGNFHMTMLLEEKENESGLSLAHGRLVCNQPKADIGSQGGLIPSTVQPLLTAFEFTLQEYPLCGLPLDGCFRKRVSSTPLCQDRR